MNIRSRLSMLGMASLVSLGVIGLATTNVFSATPEEEIQEQPPVANSVPSDTWWEDSGTNIYSFNSGNVGIGDTTPADKFVVGNGDLFRVTSTGRVRSTTGSSTTPTYSFTADTDTGMYRYGADQLAFTTAGFRRLFMDASGNVGIGGTVTPRKTLHVYGNNATIRIGAEKSTDEFDTHLEFAEQTDVAGVMNYGIGFNYANGANRLDITRYNGDAIGETVMTFPRSSSNVGIGDTTPEEKLTVQGNIKVNGNITTDGDICIGSSC